jgi:hypothetical protein
VGSDKVVKGRARREGAETQTEMGECGDVRKMRKTWGLLLGCWGGSEDEEKTRTSRAAMACQELTRNVVALAL